ncbi:MAG: N-acetylmuramoyl-L-alanine amidase [Candidatus Endonucleobacter bathymodioli]|uniref:N-acetylmuramoyl-L-alanine amidase AmiC n=1 Tax=Candidatus Endonucleibacter bathymodioli TaxID=539814 RepID=A0AA90NNU6_9GAMM|nr:N-acetylmuramoyl-L-alanine amidase [Candidatus Endonucleobacter bathymodioli]
MSWQLLRIFSRLFSNNLSESLSDTEHHLALTGQWRFLSKAAGSLCFLFSISTLTAGLAWANTAQVHDVRLWRSPDKTRLVFDVSDAVIHSELWLTNPQRLVIDIKNSQLKTNLSSLRLKNTPIKKVRHGIRNKTDLRLVLDLRQQITAKIFLLQPNTTYGYRLVIDLFDAKKKEKPAVKAKREWRNIVVAIDAGHGGEDPGALAHGGGYEKHVTLGIAKKLAALLKKAPGFASVLIRDGDYYLDLRQRTHIAREHNADLFISIHADGFKDKRARGASIFALSHSGATSETARWLAQKENLSDQIGGEGGISLNDKDDLLVGVLLDLSMTSTLSSSLEIGDEILQNIRKVSNLHKKQVEQAGFIVLKSPDIPSILVEAGFITNPQESKKLKSSTYQRKIAQSIFKGLKTWFINRPAPDTLIAKWKQEGRLKVKPKNYIIQPGDTLSDIAKAFNIRLSLLKKVNNISQADRVLAGTVLIIPD